MRRKKPEEFEKEFKELLGDEYTLLEPYYLSSVPILVRHNKCGNDYKVRPNLILRGRRCPYCNGNMAKKKTTEDFKEEVKCLVGNEYTVLGKYVNRSTNILIRHNKCNGEYFVTPGNFLSGHRCIECYYQENRCTEEQILNYIHNSIGYEYEVTRKYKYKSMQIPIEVIHKYCGHTFLVRLTDIINKHSSCPYCSASTGEVLISEWLEYHNIKYEYHKRFSDLRDKLPLSYDFFIPSLNILIEYQGIQHFKSTMFSYVDDKESQDAFIVQKKHDFIKKKYANDNGYTLLCPNYKLNTYFLISDFLYKYCK